MGGGEGKGDRWGSVLGLGEQGWQESGWGSSVVQSAIRSVRVWGEVGPLWWGQQSLKPLLQSYRVAKAIYF